MYNKAIFKTVSLKCNVKSMTGSKSHINSFITWWKKIIKLMAIHTAHTFISKALKKASQSPGHW